MNLIRFVAIVGACAFIAIATTDVPSASAKAHHHKHKPTIADLKKRFDKERTEALEGSQEWCEAFDESVSGDHIRYSDQCEIEMLDGSICTVVIINERVVGKVECPAGPAPKAPLR